MRRAAANQPSPARSAEARAATIAISTWILCLGGGLTACLTGCSIRGLATSALADSLAGSGSGMGNDDDPELVRDAVPFALKTMEQIAAVEPRHVPLRVALARGFTQYAYAFVEQEADRLDDKDMTAARPLHLRARRMYLRARDWGLDGLELRHPGLRAALVEPSGQAGRASGGPSRAELLARAEKDDAALLYWTGAAWALAIGQSKDNMRLVADLPAVEALMERALAVDESFEEGAIHDFYVSYLGGKSEADGGGAKKAREHMERARALSQNKRLSSLVSYAESVTVAAQDRKEFVRLLEQVVAFDADSDPPHRLANLIAQRRARWLLERQNDLFAD